MLIRATEAVLTSMLDEAGVNPSEPTTTDVRTTVEIFRRFAAISVDDAAPPEEDGDAVLAQYGTYDFRGQREFSADLTRQFVGSADEDPDTWQLSCTFHWPSSADTEVLTSGHLWSYGKPLGEFFTEAVALPGWAWAMAGGQPPRDLTITLDLV